MDLNKKSLLVPHDGEFTKNDNIGDTALCLNCPGFGGSNIARYGCTQSNLGINFSNTPDDGCRLVLGLGPTPSAYSNDYYSFPLKRTKGLSTALTQSFPSEADSILQLGLSGGIKETSSISVSSETDVNTPYLPNQPSTGDKQLLIPVVDEGSTSAKTSGGYMPSLLLAPRMDSCKISFRTQELLELHSTPQVSEPSLTGEYSVGTVSEQETAGTNSDQRTNNPKKCRFLGCTKGARGASGFCIGHGGGQRCQKPGCNKGAESRTAYCKAHGGGKRCQHLGCTKSAEGKTDYCIAHGGGKRCGHPGGCTKAARGKSGLCIRHGGGKRCKIDGCTRSAEGQAGLCISHGGGRRCQHQGCNKGAQGSTMFCKAHGGGKRCIFQGCTKGAEGSTPLCKGHGGGKRCLFDGGGICPKSVHGGTNFCVAHGGGKRCAVPGCTKSARGRTDCCVRHGGGKRCKFDNCGKSAQGSTDFCKAHGGGKRCSWGEGKCEKFARGKSGLCAAHSSMVQERASSKGGLIGARLFHGLVPAASTTAGSSNNHSTSAISVVSDSIDSLEKPAKRQQLIPPQVLVPLSMKSSPSYSKFLTSEKADEGRNRYDIGVGSSSRSSGRKSLDFDIPEGRVHGGPLMSLFGGNLKNAIDGI
ncbi:loricrin-like protein [Trema orientale]|uniref:Loricrin-like protein n=1 Tax=Trema orientale TaxID=63057 RepID=A0A2P5BMN0_TREOI|nr:loricrin-like protein [Trema orientale]